MESHLAAVTLDDEENTRETASETDTVHRSLKAPLEALSGWTQRSDSEAGCSTSCGVGSNSPGGRRD